MTPRAWPLICILKFLRIFHLLHLLGKNRVRYFEKIWIIKLKIDFNKYHNNEKSSKNSEKIIEILKLQKRKKIGKIKNYPEKWNNTKNEKSSKIKCLEIGKTILKMFRWWRSTEWYGGMFRCSGNKPQRQQRTMDLLL